MTHAEKEALRLELEPVLQTLESEGLDLSTLRAELREAIMCGNPACLACQDGRPEKCLRHPPVKR